jgi:hypothetical protein
LKKSIVCANLKAAIWQDTIKKNKTFRGLLNPICCEAIKTTGMKQIGLRGLGWMLKHKFHFHSGLIKGAHVTSARNARIVLLKGNVISASYGE